MTNRREFLGRLGSGFGMVALQHLLARDGYGAAGNPLAPKQPPLPAKAKRVIFLFMEGAPSQMDLFDPKPLLQEWHGKSLPASLTKDLKLAFIKPTATILGSPRTFQKYGPQGMDIADLLPHTASIAGDLCFVRSMHSDQFNHHPGQLKLFTGHNQVGRPAMGSGASGDGFVGDLRAGLGVAEPAGVCGVEFRVGDERGIG